MSCASRIVPAGELTVCGACCCSINGCISVNNPNCWGMGFTEKMLCCQGNGVCCKVLKEGENEEGKMAICCEGGQFLVTPTTCCQTQQQCCCMDSRCALPCTDQVPMMCTILPCCVAYPKIACCAKVADIKEVPEALAGEQKAREKDLSDTPVGQVRVCEACCCSICGLFFEMPKCLGCKIEGICCCIQVEQSLCKPIQEQNEDKICCICCDGGQYIVMPSTCCSVTETCFCVDYRCAFPCTDKVPCILTCLPGCVVCASKEMKFGCCPKVEDLIESYKVTPQVVM